MTDIHARTCHESPSRPESGVESAEFAAESRRIGRSLRNAFATLRLPAGTRCGAAIGYNGGVLSRPEVSPE